MDDPSSLLSVDLRELTVTSFQPDWLNQVLLVAEDSLSSSAWDF
jgi:hypothetical protein